MTSNDSKNIATLVLSIVEGVNVLVVLACLLAMPIHAKYLERQTISAVTQQFADPVKDAASANAGDEEAGEAGDDPERVCLVNV